MRYTHQSTLHQVGLSVCILLIADNLRGSDATASPFTRPSLLFSDKNPYLAPRTQLRGGAAAAAANESTPKTKKKKVKKKKSTPKPTQSDVKENGADKSRISSALKEKDAAEVLGDAIRSRAEQLRQETNSLPPTLASVGWAMGASDHYQQQQQEEESGGVEAAPSAVLAHYFLKSHGGAHAVQCACSILATMAGVGAMLLSTSNPFCLTLINRCLLFAMTKHVAGLMAATWVTARSIPEVGFRKARSWMEHLASDPVSQYVFYAACLILWLPKTMADTWWRAYPVLPALLVGPVVLREMVSTTLVLSDVLILWMTSSNTQQESIQNILETFQSVIDAFMSLLVTPDFWRSADALERQAILAKLTSRVSLSMEVAVGLVLVVDAVLAFGAFSFGPLEKRPPVLSLLKRLACARLYVHYLWSRRRKIERLATAVRGGAAELPLYLLDVLSHPLQSMGMTDKARALSK